jgi:hypothetical protein
VAGLGQRTPRQCRGTCGFDLLTDHTQQWSRLFLAQSVARLHAQYLAEGLGLDANSSSIRATIGVDTGSWGFNCTAFEKYRSACDQRPACTIFGPSI